MSLLWHIATHLARGAFKVPVIPVEITTEDVPPYVPREPQPNVCGYGPCTMPVTWPQFFCSEPHYISWVRDQQRESA